VVGRAARLPFPFSAMFSAPAPLLAASGGSLTSLDWLIIAGYFCVLIGLAWWVIRKNKDTPDDYFLAGRNLGWFIIGASIFASNIGSEHLVGLAGSGATDGVAMAHYELHAWCLLVLGWVMVPFYARSKVFTMPEFLERRFSPTARWVLSIISLVAYVLTKVAVGIFAGGIVFGTLLPELHLQIGSLELNSFWIGSILVLVLTGLYTVLGGMRAVAYTETLQTVVLVLGSLLVTLYGLAKLGGWSELRSVLDSDMFNLWKPLIPEGVTGTWAPVIEKNAAGEVVRQAWYFNGNYPWLGMLFCAPIIGLWYWCTDQYIVQRALGAPNETEARRGSIFAAFLKLLPVFIFIIPGMICFALAKSGKIPELAGLVGPDGHAIPDKSQAAFPLMVQYVLPAGVRGIVVAGLLSALMSSLAGVFNASSTLFTMDLYQKFKPKASQAQLVWTGRVATVIMVLIGLAWVPVIQGARGLYDYLQSVQGYLAPPIFVVFFFGVFMKRLNARGCLAALVVGFGLGLFRLAVDTPVSLGLQGFAGYAEGSFFWIVNHIYFQYFSLLIFLISGAVMIGVSYLSPAPDEARIQGLTYGTISDADRAHSRSSWTRWDVLASALVLLLILSAYLYFSG
jgi:SSS family solute:Na+ symporter